MMTSNIFFLCLLSFILHSLTEAVFLKFITGSIASMNTTNKTTAEAQPKRVNSTSKHSYLLNSERSSLEAISDVAVKSPTHLKNVPEKSIDVNSILSEAALEAIGDAVMAEKLNRKSKLSTATLPSTTKLKSNRTGNIAEKDICVN
ncbi:hypothetical protein HUJ04_007479 [Dendroctonus ponderosae]